MYKILGADGEIYGPVTPEQMRQWIAEGRAVAESQVMIDGVNTWRQLRSYPDLFPSLPPVYSAPPGTIGSLAPTPRPSTNGFALTSFILSLLAVPCCVFPVFSLLGLIFSTISLIQLRTRPWQTGRALAIIALILSALGLVATIIFYLVQGVAGLGILDAAPKFY